MSHAVLALPWVRRIQTEVFDWRGLTVLLSYEPDWLNLGAAGLRPHMAHVELQVLSPVGAPLPLSETGYWSDFFEPVGRVELEDAKAMVFALLTEFEDTLSWRVALAEWELREECSLQPA